MSSDLKKKYDQMNCIIKKEGQLGAIYLGSLDAAKNLQKLKENNIGAVLTVISQEVVTFGNQIQHLYIKADDKEFQQIEQFFNQSNEFIDKARKTTNILIHCRAGISRSATLLIAYIMYKYSWSLEQTTNYIKTIRWFVQPNPSFMKQLKRYEARLNIQRRIMNVAETKPTEYQADENRNLLGRPQSLPKFSDKTYEVPKNKDQSQTNFNNKQSNERPLVTHEQQTNIQKPISQYPYQAFSGRNTQMQRQNNNISFQHPYAKGNKPNDLSPQQITQPSQHFRIESKNNQNKGQPHKSQSFIMPNYQPLNIQSNQNYRPYHQQQQYFYRPIHL